MTWMAGVRARVAAGGCWVPQDWPGEELRAAMALSRLARAGVIQHVGKGVYAAGSVDERAVVAAVLRKLGEPRFLPARGTALEALGIPVTVPDPAAITTGPTARRFAGTLPGWALLRRDPVRRGLSIEANAVLEALRYRPRWPVGAEAEITAALRAAVAQLPTDDWGPALAREAPRHRAAFAHL